MWLLCLTAGWLMGVAAGLVLSIPTLIAAVLLPVPVLACMWARRRQRRLVFLAALAAAAGTAGVLRTVADQPDGPPPLANYLGQPVLARGVVASTPDPAGQAVRFHFRVREIQGPEGRSAEQGLIEVTARLPYELAIRRDVSSGYMPGDVLLLQGKLREPEPYAGFDPRAVLALEGIDFVMVFPDAVLEKTGEASPLTRALFDARMRLAAALDRSLPEPEASLAQAFILGLRQTSPDINEDFRRSGAAHLLSISGQHIGVLLGVLVVLARPLPWRPRWLAHAFPVAVVWLYVLLAGWPVSAVRAALMASLYMAAAMAGRQRSGLDALLWAAFLITAADPTAPRQISFQLSFAAMPGIILAGLPAAERLPHWPGTWGWLARWAAFVAVLSAAASIATMPALSYHFGRISLLSIPASLLTLAAMPLALAGSFVAAVAGLFSTEAGWLAGWGAWLPLVWIRWWAHVFALPPFASVTAGLNGAAAIAAYTAGGALVWLAYRRHWLGPDAPQPAGAAWTERGSPLRTFRAAAMGLGLVAAVTWTAALAQHPEPTLRVHFLDVGRGEAALIETPAGQRVLVDGGSDPRRLRPALDRLTGYAGRRLDLVIVSSAQPEHAGGLYFGLRRYAVQAILTPETPASFSGLSEDWDTQRRAALAAWTRTAEEKGVKTVRAATGMVIDLGGGIQIEVLNPAVRPLEGSASDIDNNSAVLRLTYGQASYLLAGGIRPLGEDFLLSQDLPLQSDVLKLPRALDPKSASQPFLRAAAPAWVVLSGTNEEEGPSRAVIERVRSALPGAHLLTPGSSGTVTLVSDGGSIWVSGA